MEIIPEDFLVSENYKSAKPELILTYVTIRAMEKYGKDSSPQSIAEHVSLHELTVKRYVTTLKSMGWIYEVEGKLFTTDEDGSCMLLSVISTPKKYEKKKAQVAEDKFSALQERLKKEHQHIAIKKLQRAAKLKPRQRVYKGKDVYAYFCKVYKEKYGEEYKFNATKARVFCARTLTNSGDDFQYVCKILDFIFDEWDKLKSYLKFTNDKPTVNFIGTYSIWSNVRGYYENGFRSDFKIKDRGKYEDDDEEFKVGWD